jgi:hypothetical protein
MLPWYLVQLYGRFTGLKSNTAVQPQFYSFVRVLVSTSTMAYVVLLLFYLYHFHCAHTHTLLSFQILSYTLYIVY